ncbi:MAG: amidohydrolase [Chloroflexota bacterium]
MPEIPGPDLILYNGKLYTQDPDTTGATAVAIGQGRFLAVGDDGQIRRLAVPATRTVDLGGRRVLPGLIDAHFHFYSWALSRRRLSLVGAGSLSDLRRRLAERASDTPAAEWILGQGWNESRWPTPRKPTRADLDDVAPEHPVLLWRSDLHLAVANSRALRQAGVDADTLDPPQGRIDRDDQRRPTGVLRERAVDLVKEAVPEPSEDQVVEAMREGFGVLHRLGLTGVHDHRIMGGADGRPAFHAYQRLHERDELALRLWMGIPGERLDEAMALGLRSGFGGERLRVGHVKLFSDGSQGARTAWMLEPYDDTGDAGMPLTPMDEIAEAVERAHRAGLAVAVHAIGDRANRELIRVFEERTKSEGPCVPHRIEHAQIVRPADVERLGRRRRPRRLGVAASVQPIHVTDDIPMSEVSIGARTRFAYPFRDMLDAGVTLAFGSDAPVADPNPLWGVHAAVTRQQRDGSPEGGWHPEQRLTVAEAVWAFTVGPAVVSGQQKDLGAIAPGKLADLVVLDRDIFAIDPMGIHRARVVMTVFDGDVVHEG